MPHLPCVKTEHSIKLWSAFEIMKLLNSRKLSFVLTDLLRMEEWCDEYRRRVAAPRNQLLLGPSQAPFPNIPDGVDWQKVTNRLKEAEELCKETGWEAAHSKIALINLHLEYGRDQCDWSSLAADLRNASDVIVDALWQGKFVQVAALYTDYIENDALCGEEVKKKAFPSASEDLCQAGNCIGVDCGTAAVFHLMRAVEWGMRALAADWGVIGAPHKSRTVPIEFSQWEKILAQLYPAVETKINALPAGQHKQDMQEFYFPILHEIRGFKDAFRNHVMHTRKSYTQQEADEVLRYVRRFKQVLSHKDCRMTKPNPDRYLGSAKAT